MEKNARAAIIHARGLKYLPNEDVIERCLGSGSFVSRLCLLPLIQSAISICACSFFSSSVVLDAFTFFFLPYDSP